MKSRKSKFGAVLFCLASIVLAAATGCGGNSQNDMRRMGIRRAKDVDAPLPPDPNKLAAKKPPEDAHDHEQDSNPTAAAPAKQAQAAPSKPVADPAATKTAPVASPLKPAAAQTTAATDPSTTPAAGKSISDTQVAPAVALDADARARRTVDNMTKIGHAWQAYLADKKVHPRRAVFDRNNKALLSWRVELLPYLGYKELHAQFHLDEPWGSRHNRPLLEKIPAVYQSPERFDEKCNYLLPVGANTIFGMNRNAMPSDIEDGAGNTALLVEADDTLAVPWTEPRDFDFEYNQPKQNLGALRGGSFFVIWGDGEVGRVLTTAPLASLKAMFTYDAGENFVAGNIDQPLFTSTRPAPPTPSNGKNPVASDQPPGASSRPAQSTTDAALASLAAGYLENADTERATGGDRAAADWSYAAAIASPPGSPWADQYQWVPALRRPTPPIRLGVGLQYSGPRAAEVHDAVAQRSTGYGSKAWSLVTTKVGDEIVRILSSHVNQGDDSAGKRPPRPPARRTSPLDATPGAPLAPNVYYLATAREGVLREAAEREGVDVFVFVDWREVGKNYSFQLSLIDALRNQTLLELPRVDSGQIDRARTDPLVDNPLSNALHKLSDFLAEQLTPQPLPKQIEPRHVVTRMAALSNTKSDNPLRALAEMRYYRERGLATDTQLLLGYQTLIGQGPGSELFLGDATARGRILKAWLPRPPDRATAQRTLPTASDDD